MTQPPQNSPERPAHQPQDPYDPYGRSGGQQPPPGQPYGQQPYGAGGQQPPPPYGGASTYGMPYGYGDPTEDLASRWARFGGGIIDGVILLVIQAILVGPTIQWSHIGDAGYTQVEIAGRGGTVAAELIAAVISFLYVWVQHAKWGQTLGKRAVSTRLVRAEDGGAVSWGQAAGRIAFSYLLSFVCGFLTLVDLAWILWDPRRQALHDKVAKTVVVKVDPTGRDPYRER